MVAFSWFFGGGLVGVMMAWMAFDTVSTFLATDAMKDETWFFPLWRSAMAFRIAATSATSLDTWAERLLMVTMRTMKMSLFERSWVAALLQMWL